MKDREAAGSDRLSILVQASRLPQDGLVIRFEASEAERDAVARRFDLQGVDALAADLVARRWQANGVVVEGALTADVVQTDVVSLQPVRQSIGEEVRLFFVPEGSRLAQTLVSDEAEIEVDPAEDVPETFRGDSIDVGEPLTQIFGLALDPYPRNSGTEFAEVREGEKEPSPFAVLATLRDKKNG